jgi:hypothetical protein
MKEKEEYDCKYFFGFLSNKDKNESVPPECVECKKVIECMLKEYYQSKEAVEQIKKWY